MIPAVIGAKRLLTLCYLHKLREYLPGLPSSKIGVN